MTGGVQVFEPSTILVTGGAGFIGSNFTRWVLDHAPHVRVVNLDLLTYAANLESLDDVALKHGTNGEGRHRFVHGDIADTDLVASLIQGDHPACDRWPQTNAVVHFAAESHVDRSIHGPEVFAHTNLIGTLRLLEAARASLAQSERPFRFLHVSTDEVYGTLAEGDPAFTELTPLAPNSPYSATKAGSDFLVRSYVETFGLPALTTRCSNNYGPYQFPEKLIPLMVTRALADQPLPVYGDGRNRRDWIHVLDHALALWSVLTRGEVGEVYNVGGECEVSNLEIVTRILELVEKPRSLISFVKDRPGHDFRYAVDVEKIRTSLGWSPAVKFTTGLQDTVEWYLANRGWWSRVQSEAYRTANAHYLSST